MKAVQAKVDGLIRTITIHVKIAVLIDIVNFI
jgi:hypothetical protein